MVAFHRSVPQCAASHHDANIRRMTTRWESPHRKGIRCKWTLTVSCSAILLFWRQAANCYLRCGAVRTAPRSTARHRTSTHLHRLRCRALYCGAERL